MPTSIAGFFKPQLRGDIGAHALGGGGRVGVHAGPRKAALELGELAIFRAEVVSPVADAMGFVDGEGAHVPTRSASCRKSRREQTFRRNEQQPVAARGKLFFRLAGPRAAGMPL